jgi:hypothetical protein
MRDEWYASLWRIGKWLLTRLLLPVVTAATPIVIAYGLVHPDTDAIAALKLGSHDKALLVGFGSRASCHVASDNDCSSVTTKTYLILPGLSGATVEEARSAVAVSTTRSVGIEILLIWLVGAWCAWRYWLRPIASNFRWNGHAASSSANVGRNR